MLKDKLTIYLRNSEQKKEKNIFVYICVCVFYKRLSVTIHEMLLRLI